MFGRTLDSLNVQLFLVVPGYSFVHIPLSPNQSVNGITAVSATLPNVAFHSFRVFFVAVQSKILDAN
jgi:hypothetical protein